MRDCKLCMTGKNCEEHKLKQKKENFWDDNDFKVKDLVIHNAHDKLKDFILKKFKK